MPRKITYVPLDIFLQNYVHLPKKTRMCRFAEKCYKHKLGVCTFAHSEAELFVPDCKFGNNCRRKDTCRFKHPVVKKIVISNDLGDVYCANNFPNLSLFKAISYPIHSFKHIISNIADVRMQDGVCRVPRMHPDQIDLLLAKNNIKRYIFEI